MSTPRLGGLGTVVARLGSSAPSPAVLTVHETSGRVVTRRRFHERTVAMLLPAGDYRFTVEDERRLDDPRRLAGETIDVAVRPHAVVVAELSLAPAGALHVALVREGVGQRFGRLRARHLDGESYDVRADRTGLVRLHGLRPGLWSVSGTDARRAWGSAPALLPIVADAAPDTVHLEIDAPTASLLVEVPGTHDGLEVEVVDGVGLVHRCPVADGAAHVRGLAAGTQTVAVAAPAGAGAAPVVVADLAPGELASIVLTLPAGRIRGRVVGGPDLTDRYAAAVTLLDDTGTELARTRTDEHGRFELSAGAATRSGLTVVAATGPESLHVTRTATADVTLRPGVCLDLGDLVLPVGGDEAVWTPSHRTVAAMKLPSTRV